MTTTNDAMYEALVVAYPLAGATLGDLLYEFWSEVGLEYRGTLQSEFFQGEGAVGSTLGDLMNSYFVDVYPTAVDLETFSTDDFEEWLELQIFDRYDTVEQTLFSL